jgi:hypothetical protein
LLITGTPLKLCPLSDLISIVRSSVTLFSCTCGFALTDSPRSSKVNDGYGSPNGWFCTTWEMAGLLTLGAKVAVTMG